VIRKKSAHRSSPSQKPHFLSQQPITISSPTKPQITSGTIQNHIQGAPAPAGSATGGDLVSWALAFLASLISSLTSFSNGTSNENTGVASPCVAIVATMHDPTTTAVREYHMTSSGIIPPRRSLICSSSLTNHWWSFSNKGVGRLRSRPTSLLTLSLQTNPPHVLTCYEWPKINRRASARVLGICRCGGALLQSVSWPRG